MFDLKKWAFFFFFDLRCDQPRHYLVCVHEFVFKHLIEKKKR